MYCYLNVFCFFCFLFFFCLFVFFFFFFQAEDGIRDIGVTGVQTCALPISIQLIIRHKLRVESSAFREGRIAI